MCIINFQERSILSRLRPLETLSSKSESLIPEIIAEISTRFVTLFTLGFYIWICFNLYSTKNGIVTWTASWQNQQNDCEPSEDSDQPGHPPSLIRVRSAWASAQSDQSIRCALNGYLRTQGFIMRTMKTLIRLGAHATLLVLSWGGSHEFTEKINFWYVVNLTF